MKTKLAIYSIVFSVLMLSCKKETFITSSDARVSFSTDSLHFDTVFTTTGSVTQLVKIRNENNQKLRLNRVTLKGGSGSAFRINVDGYPGPIVPEIELAANDSLYVFVSVSINQNASNLPFVAQDSIEVVYNGVTRFIQLDAWGQNAHFLRNQKLTGQTIWTNDLPYVILGQIQVDTNAKLTIQKGCRIYFHADAPFLVDGTLIVNGEKANEDRVYFQSDRRDAPYSEYPGSWPGIYLRERSVSNVLRYAVIKNAYQGVVSELPARNGTTKALLEQCVIDNIYDAGIFGLQTSIIARNCLISNCGKNIVLAYGGDYQFNHCTVATVSTSYIPHKEPVLYLTNFVKQNNTTVTRDLTASFTNCIFWGDNGVAEDEVVILKEGTTGAFQVSFTNSLLKNKNQPANATLTKVITNVNPQFDSLDVQKRYFSFRLKDGSPAINQGLASGLAVDLDGNPRPVGIPDIGAYERQ